MHKLKYAHKLKSIHKLKCVCLATCLGFGNLWKEVTYKTIHFVIKEFHNYLEKLNVAYEFPLSYGCLSCSIQLPIKFVRFVDPENSIGLDKTAKYAVSFD